ncbi:ATP-binding protein [Micromonospora sp. NBC_01699]|uniref:sensor histidine kinase n=1 Tax=Micromonospora sp. NBC_01699 TaxID=2975984 RepID=UPI002E29FBE6|nr:ATP-binding protein [Micromonospora sp. NBC_01699]
MSTATSALRPYGWSLRRRVTALLVVVGSVLALLAVGEALVANANRTHLDTLLTKTGPLRTDAESLPTALVDQETAVRGYAVSGDRADLAPYDEGIGQEGVLISRMDALLDDQPEIRRQLHLVRDQAERWRAEVAQPIVDATTSGGPSAGQLLVNERGRQQFDALRGSTSRLQELILDLRNEVATKARKTGNTLVLLLILAGVVVVLAGVALLVSLNRAVIGPVTRLAEQVRAVAQGDYQRDIEQTGPPELALLAADVDAMRRKIAADLAEVREARTRIEWVNSQLQKQAEELVRSNRDLEQFAYVASHDLQEPLRKVASFCQLLQRRYAGQLDERADQYIAFAVDGAQRMQRLINDLLAFSRIGRLTTGFAEVDLNQVMGDVAGQTEAARQYAGGELTWSDLPVVLGEEPLLTNLLANLVSNSFKFRRPDVPPLVRISARRVDDEWEISCEDNGIGIEPEFVDKVFVIFQRLHSKDAYPGTGIGLAIVKKIVEYHGGRIWVDLEATEGTVIRFTLPVTVEVEQPETVEVDQPETVEVDQPELAAAPAVPGQSAGPDGSRPDDDNSNEPDGPAAAGPDGPQTGGMKEIVA